MNIEELKEYFSSINGLEPYFDSEWIRKTILKEESKTEQRKEKIKAIYDE